MNNIPIFDCITHPTINNNWILPQYKDKSNINKLLFEMDKHNVCNAFAVGMDNIGDYNEIKYSEYIYSYTDKLYPIAWFNINEYKNITEVIKKIKLLKKLKYKGIKLHPRFAKFNLLHPLLPSILKAANDENMIVLLCTYFYENNINTKYNNVESLIDLLIKVPEEKIILLHSGGVKLLEYMEIARVFKNILLDLSFTLGKYMGSSLDMDIQFLFNNFDKRICIGSDFPEISIKVLRQQFDLFSRNIQLQKAENIAFKNIINYFN